MFYMFVLAKLLIIKKYWNSLFTEVKQAVLKNLKSPYIETGFKVNMKFYMLMFCSQ